MGRSPCCEKVHTNKGAWTKEEDERLINYIKRYGEGCWRSLPRAAGLLRCGKSCRLRWINYLRPDLKRGNFTGDEDELIINLHSVLGNKWSLIAARLSGRTDNEIKNYWNTHIKRKLIARGIDPQTHRPLNQAPTTATTSNKGSDQAAATIISSVENSLTTVMKVPESFNTRIDENHEISNAYSNKKSSNSGEGSSSCSGTGIRMEKKCPEINLELSIGLPCSTQMSNVIQEQKVSIQLSGTSSSCPIVNSVQNVCFRCHLGFLNGQYSCTCSSMAGSRAIVASTENFSRQYRPLNS